MKCPSCNENTISHWHAFWSAPLIKIKCKVCGARFYYGGLIVIIANIFTHLGALVLLALFLIYLSMFYIGLFVLLMVSYHFMKIKFGKFVVINGI